MSSLSPKTILPPKRRREIIRDHILTHSFQALATLCKCTKRTIIRDVHQWRQTGGFEQFLVDEFFTSYPQIKKQFPDKAFDRLCYLLGKTMIRKIEAKTEIREIKLLWEIKDEHTHTKDTVFATQRAAKLSREQS